MTKDWRNGDQSLQFQHICVHCYSYYIIPHYNTHTHWKLFCITTHTLETIPHYNTHTGNYSTLQHTHTGNYSALQHTHWKLFRITTHTLETILHYKTHTTLSTVCVIWHINGWTEFCGKQCRQPLTVSYYDRRLKENNSSTSGALLDYISSHTTETVSQFPVHCFSYYHSLYSMCSDCPMINYGAVA